MNAETLARLFHETYERLAPEHSYQTRKESTKPWAEVPENNKSLLVAVCGELLTQLQPPANRIIMPHLELAIRAVALKAPDLEQLFQAYLADQDDPAGLKIMNLRLVAQFLRQHLEIIDNLLAHLEKRG